VIKLLEFILDALLSEKKPDIILPILIENLMETLPNSTASQFTKGTSSFITHERKIFV